MVVGGFRTGFKYQSKRPYQAQAHPATSILRWYTEAHPATLKRTLVY